MLTRLYKPLVFLAGLVGLVAICAGLFLANTSLWRLLLVVGLAFMWLPLQTFLNQPKRTAARGLSRLSLVFALGFVGVALQLVRDQVSQAPDIRTRASQVFQPAPDADVASTAIRPADRTSLGRQQTFDVEIGSVQRGNIVDRNGVVLATTQSGRRSYPNPDMGQIVGFASRLYGNSGVEDSYDTYLSGARSLSPQQILQARLVGTPVTTSPAEVKLTIDSALQQVAQAALGDRPGAVVLIDTQTGALLALASYPRFDPNQLVLPAEASDADVASVQAAWKTLTERADSPLLNRATQGRYPPGSVIKTLTAAAALDAGVTSGGDGQITCPNRLETEAGAPPVRNAVENLAQRTGDPSDLRRVFAFSCNTAFAQLGLQLGADRFAEYAARFGLYYADAEGVAPDLRDIPADVGSIAGDKAFLQRPVALADTAFGQGQALVTPLDMAQMTAAIANDGRSMRPYLVQEARAGDQALYTAQPEVLREVIRPDSAQKLRAVMQSSVEIGYANPVALPGVTIGAKTGTAENPSGVPHSWFVALAPVEQPRFAIAVIVENGGEGSRSALPVAKQVLAAALGVQP
jgi:peptidoglycan glycosyltransferase